MQKPGDYGLKNVTPFPRATIFIVTEATPPTKGMLREFLETFGYVNHRQFVIAFCEIDRRGGYHKIGCKRGRRRVSSENKAGASDKSRLAR